MFRREKKYIPLTDGESVPESIQKPLKEEAGVPASIFNTVASIIGGGILALPFTFELTGLLLGLFLVIFLGLLNALGAYLLIRTSLLQFDRPASYRELAQVFFGRAGVWFVEIALVIDLVGACAAYLLIVGEIAIPFAERAFGEGSWATDKRFVLAVILFALPVPLSFIRKISRLSFTSTLSFLCIIFLTGAIVFRAVENLVIITNSSDSSSYDPKIPHDLSGNLEEVRLFKWSSSIFRAMPIISFAFNFHLQLYSIWNSMKEPEKAGRVFGSSILICFLVYTIVGIFGYLSFFRGTSKNILDNYQGDPVFQVSTALLGFMICFAYPLKLYPVLEAFETWFFPGKAPSYWRRIPECLLLAILIWGLAVATPDIAVVFGYEGAVLGNLLVFIIPSAFYIAAARQSQRRWFRHPLLLTSWALAGLGLVLVVASFWTITSSLVPDTSNLP